MNYNKTLSKNAQKRRVVIKEVVSEALMYVFIFGVLAFMFFNPF